MRLRHANTGGWVRLIRGIPGQLVVMLCGGVDCRVQVSSFLWQTLNSLAQLIGLGKKGDRSGNSSRGLTDLGCGGIKAG